MTTLFKIPWAGVLALAVAAGSAGHALAQSQEASGLKTRAQVKAELLEAQRTGNIMADDEGKTLREMFPGRYPAASTPGQSLSRAQVKESVRNMPRSTDDIYHGG